MKKKLALNILSFILITAIAASIIIFVSDKLGFIKFSEIKDTLSSNIDSVSNDSEDEVEEVQDDRPLEIIAVTDPRTIFEGQTAIEIKANKEISIDQSNRMNLFFVKKDVTTYWYVLEINNIGQGDSTVKVDFKDKASNVKTETFAFTRRSVGLPSGVSSIEDWPNSVYTVDGNNSLALIDRAHKLVDEYAPTEDDLVDLNKDYLLYTNADGILLRKEAADNLKLMINSLQAEKNENLIIATAYRSFSDQVKLYSYWYTQKGKDGADITSARPGFSEHQLGTAVDFISVSTNYALVQDFDNTVAGIWLRENSYKFGFVQSNHNGVEQINGVPYEAWHYRYIGVEKATQYKESGLTFPEWIKQENSK